MEQKKKREEHCLTSERFTEQVKQQIDQIKNGRQLTLIALDFDNFNYINDLFGYEMGDRVLERISKHFDEVLSDEDLFCRLHADHYLFCLQTGESFIATETFAKLTDLRQTLSDLLPRHYTLSASGGILHVQDDSVPLPALVDQANCARKLSKGAAVNTYHLYDQKINAEVQWKKQVTCMMEAALNNREFEMYLQPKVLLKTEEIIGAEALVRWNSPVYGMIYPDRFIPILEQNGFIQRLDFFMLEEACLFLDSCKENGWPVLPISVNFSRTHLQAPNLVQRVFETVNHREISPELIEIEFTETILSENIEWLIEIVTDLKMLGFQVSIDDFGSAYSSLNYLKDLPVDIVKLDRVFLNASADTDRGRLVIAKVVELVKSLRMLSVMEGVETQEQVEFLQRLGCDVAQGYFYARPMPAGDYLNSIQRKPVAKRTPSTPVTISRDGRIDESYLHVIAQEFQMNNWELYMLGKNIDIGLMKGYLDGEATAQYVNDRALEYLGYTRQEFCDLMHNSVSAFTHPEDEAIVQKNFDQIVQDGKPLQFQTRAIRKDGKIIVLQGRASCVIDDHGRPVGLYAFQDVTVELERTVALERQIKELEEAIFAEQQSREALRLSEERFRIIVEQSDDIMFEWDFGTDTITFSSKFKALFGREPNGTTKVTENQGIRQSIHPEDQKAFDLWVTNTYGKPGRSEESFRVADAWGNYLWITCSSTALCDQQGVPMRAVGVFANIQAQRQLLDDLRQRAQLDPLTRLLNKSECQNRINRHLENYPGEQGALFMIDVDNFKDINDNLGHQLGDTMLQEIAEKMRLIFPESEMLGRIGGDEFVVYLPDAEEQSIRDKAENLSRILRLSYFGSVSKYEISGSIGIARFPEQGTCFEDLYHYADIALYQAKKSGKNRFVLYDSGIVSHLIDNRTPVEYCANFLNTYFQDDITFQVFGMLYETRDISATIHMLLELLGKRFGVDRVYIFEEVHEEECLRNTYEWCAPGICPQIDTLQQIPLSMLSSYFQQYSVEGVFCCENIDLTSPEVYEICEPQGIKSLLHCAIYNAGERIGFIGFDFCSEYHSWSGDEIAVLGYISRILSVFMVRNVMSDQLKVVYHNYEEMVENLNGFVYVVDPTTFEVLFVSRSIRELGLKAGRPCYEIAFGVDCQCENCPIRQIDETVHYASNEIYSQVLQGWVHAAASKLKWGENKEAVLVYCTDISKYKK